MKLRIVDRIVAAVAGLLLAALSLIPLIDFLANARIFARLAEISAVKSASHIIFMVGGGIVVLLMGILCLHLAFRRSKRKDFVVQSTDAGELSISIKAIDNLVQRCVEKHEELHVTSTTLENTRDGLVIGMRVGLANGVNIPLAVNALQKQIRQYVTACSGVDVHEVKVQVDTTAAKGKPSVYAVPDMLENVTLPRNDAPVPEEPVAPAAEEAAEEKEEKCLHQRLFGEEEQPAIVPMPPEMMEEAAEAPAEEPVAEEPAEEQPDQQEEPLPADEAPEADPCEEEALPEQEEADEAADEVPDDVAFPEEVAEEDGLDEESVADLEALDGAEDFTEEEPGEEEIAEEEPTEEIPAEPALTGEAEEITPEAEA